MSTERFKNVKSCFVINLLNNKTIILLNLAGLSSSGTDYALLTVNLRSRKTVRYSEQIMSAEKYPSIFSRQMEAVV